MFIKTSNFESEWIFNVDHIVSIQSRNSGQFFFHLSNGDQIEIDVDETVLKAALGVVTVDPTETGLIDTSDSQQDDGIVWVFEKEFGKSVQKYIDKKIDDGEINADPDLVESLRKLIIPKEKKGDK